jgi:hypothetical protein
MCYGSCLIVSTIQCRSHALEQRFIVERFDEKLYRPRPKGLHPHFFVAMRRNEDDWNLTSFIVQLGLEFQA